jgi:type IV pilus assembly protein PilP
MKRKNRNILLIVSLLSLFFFFWGCGSDKEEVPGKPKVEMRKIGSQGKTASTQMKVATSTAAKMDAEKKAIAVSGSGQAEKVQKPNFQEPKKLSSDTVLSIGSKVKADALKIKMETETAKDVTLPAQTLKKPDLAPALPAKEEKLTLKDEKLADVGQTFINVKKEVPSEQAALILRTVSSSYDPTGRIDPFVPLLKTKEKQEEQKSNRKKRPQRRLTPLEKVDLDQLKLVGVILAPSGNMALVEEASGKGYIVSTGTRIGINSGKISEILQDQIIVDEEVEDLTGKITRAKRPLKIQKSPGD